MKSICSRILLFLICAQIAYSSSSQETYYPGQWGDWEKKPPAELGVDERAIERAMQYAQENEAKALRNLEHNHYLSFGKKPFGDAVGPHKTRGAQTGIIGKNGYIIAEWGEPHRVDMTFSVSKSFLSSTVGLAFDHGLIKSVHDPVRNYMGPVLFVEDSQGPNKAHQFNEPKVHELFESEHNRKITWNHLLRQTSDWEGTLFGKPDWAGRPSGEPSEWITRTRNEPGTVFEYNDVRVNLLALAATNIWRKPLPQVLKKHLMDLSWAINFFTDNGNANGANAGFYMESFLPRIGHVRYCLFNWYDY